MQLKKQILNQVFAYKKELNRSSHFPLNLVIYHETFDRTEELALCHYADSLVYSARV